MLQDLMQELVFEPTTKLTDTIVEAYPCNDRVLVLVELLGDGNAEDANAFDFAPSGDKLIHWTRTPSAWLDGKKLIGAKGSLVSDADTTVLGNEIKKRLKDSPELSKDGFLWEPSEIINLPFCCEPMLFNSKGLPIDSYLAQGNENGYRWGYFWLFREGCNPQSAKKLVFTCHQEVDDDEVSQCFPVGEDDDSVCVSEATEVCDEEEMDKDDDLMECESNSGVGNQLEGRSDLSVMRGMFTEEIALRKEAEEKRKAALDAKKMAEDQAKSAEEEAKKKEEEAKKKQGEAAEALRKAEEDKKIMQEEAQKAIDEANVRAMRDTKRMQEAAQKAIDDANARAMRAEVEEQRQSNQVAAEENQRVEQAVAQEKQRFVQAAAEEKQKIQEEARQHFEKVAAEAKNRLQEEARQCFEQAAAEEKERIQREVRMECEELRREADDAKRTAEAVKREKQRRDEAVRREQEQRDEEEETIASRCTGQKFRASRSTDQQPPSKRARVETPKRTSKRILRAKRPARPREATNPALEAEEDNN